MAEATRREFPLFLLGMAAVPHELVPLHVFEPRYLAMIARCIDEVIEFGIIWEDEEGLRDVGCAMEVTERVERLDDGRMNVVARGTRPFRVVGERGDVPYPVATVQLLDDDIEEPEDDAVEAAHDAYAHLVERATDSPPEPDRLAALTAYEMAATVDFGPAAKQGLLDLRSENARLDLLTRLLRAADKRLDQVDLAEARARSNGKVRFG